MAVRRRRAALPTAEQKAAIEEERRKNRERAKAEPGNSRKSEEDRKSNRRANVAEPGVQPVRKWRAAMAEPGVTPDRSVPVVEGIYLVVGSRPVCGKKKGELVKLKATESVVKSLIETGHIEEAPAEESVEEVAIAAMDSAEETEQE